MNVRCAHFERVNDDLVHQPDQRRVRLHRAAVRRRQFRKRGDFDLTPRDFLDHRLHDAVAPAAVVLAKRGFDFRLRGHL